MKILSHAPLVAAVFALAAPGTFAQAPSTYRQPPEAIRQVLDAPVLPIRLIDPSNATLALIETRRYPAIEELSRPFLRLAGLRIDPASNGPQRTQHINRLTLRPLLDATAPAVEVKLPAGGDFHSMRFLPVGRRFVLLRRTQSSTELWLGDTARGSARKLEGIAVQAIGDESTEWLG